MNLLGGVELAGLGLAPPIVDFAASVSSPRFLLLQQAESLDYNFVRGAEFSGGHFLPNEFFERYGQAHIHIQMSS